MQPEAGLAFAHQRLSIIDLSPAGAQPMTSSCGRHVIVYNGEIYNAPELRAELEAAGRPFRGHSDTEVLLEACAQWGVRQAVKRVIGMFAFAIWDRRDRRLTLVRDRVGIKPLYWCRSGPLFLFGSELKAMRRHPDWQPDIDRNAVAAYFRHNYIPAPHTIYLGAHKLMPGCLLEFEAGKEPAIEAYWSLDDVVAQGRNDVFDGSDEAAVDALEDLLGDAVSRRMISDVPLGAFLSGGIDSSAVVALMQKVASRPVRTFSIGFDVPAYDEAPHAAKIARHLGTDHTELYVRPEEAWEFIPQLPQIYDEPFADSSQIPTLLLSKMTREHVTVALSGDGGDELFAGYNRYFKAKQLVGLINATPSPLRAAAAMAARSFSPGFWNTVLGVLPSRLRLPQAGDKVHRLADILTTDPDQIYTDLISHWGDPESLVPGASEPKGVIWDGSVAERIADPIDRMRYLDILTYLPDDILTKVDRASMAVSLEARVPILDHRVVEFAWRLPAEFKIRDGQGKWLLRRLLDRHVPRELVERPKMGFGVPIDAWLRGPLRDWAEDLLNPHALARHGLVAAEPVAVKWREHLSGRRSWQYHIWDVLMLQAWCEAQSGD
jgi:asparagine synthase (glutamine-hydrolysing)